MQVCPPSSIANLRVIDAELRIHIQERVPQLSTNMFNDCRRQFFHTGSICQSSIDFEPSVGEEIYTGKLILAERERPILVCEAPILDYFNLMVSCRN